MTKILPETGSLMSSILSGAKFYNDYDDNFFDLEIAEQYYNYLLV